MSVQSEVAFDHLEDAAAKMRLARGLLADHECRDAAACDTYEELANLVSSVSAFIAKHRGPHA